jgi:hypothetical protein
MADTTKPENSIKTSSLRVNMAEGIMSAQSAGLPDPPKIKLNFVNENDYLSQFNTDPILYWGENNQFPDELHAAARKSGLLKQALKARNSLMFDQGIMMYTDIPDAAPDEPSIKIVTDTKITAWHQAINANRFAADAIRDYDFYGNSWAVLQLNEKRNIVAGLQARKARYCRLEKHHPDTGRIENFYESAQWINNVRLTSGLIPDHLKKWFSKYPLLDQTEALDQMQVMDNEWNFGYHTTEVSSDTDYGESPWHATHLNGWLEISSSVPQLKKRLFLYAMTLNYIIYIDDDYWVTVFGDEFKKWKGNKREEAVKDLQDSIERNLMGKDNSWKSVFGSIKYTAEGKEKRAIIIEAIDNKLREGTFIPDDLHANSAIVVGVGIDACLFGATIYGDKVSSGSGSPIREQRTNTIGMMEMDRNEVLAPLKLAHDYSGFPKEIKYGFRALILNSLDGTRPPSTSKTTSK